MGYAPIEAIVLFDNFFRVAKAVGKMRKRKIKR
jgi:translation initiation factor IF-1